jgi:hypothetical protein
MKLAIVGVANVGSNLAEAAVAAGHAVTLAADNPRARTQGRRRSRRARDRIGRRGRDRRPRGRHRGPLPVAADVVRRLEPGESGTAVIDATNPVNDTVDDLVAEPSAAEELQRSRRARSSSRRSIRSSPHATPIPLKAAPGSKRSMP